MRFIDHPEAQLAELSPAIVDEPSYRCVRFQFEMPRPRGSRIVMLIEVRAYRSGEVAPWPEADLRIDSRPPLYTPAGLRAIDARCWLVLSSVVDRAFAEYARTFGA